VLNTELFLPYKISKSYFAAIHCKLKITPQTRMHIHTCTFVHTMHYAHNTLHRNKIYGVHVHTHKQTDRPYGGQYKPQYRTHHFYSGQLSLVRVWARISYYQICPHYTILTGQTLRSSYTNNNRRITLLT